MVKVIRNIASVIVPNFTCIHTQIFGMSVTSRSLHAVHLEKMHMRAHHDENVCTWDVTEGIPNAGTFASFLVCALVLQCNAKPSNARKQLVVSSHTHRSQMHSVAEW